MPKMQKYYCCACGEFLYRDHGKIWFKSYCSKSGKDVRCYLYNYRSPRRQNGTTMTGKIRGPYRKRGEA